MDDDEFAELLGCGGNMVQPKWNIEGPNNPTIGGGRETLYIPTYEEKKDNDDDFFKV